MNSIVSALRFFLLKHLTGPTLRADWSEYAADIRVIQAPLGHSKLENTALYTKVATRTVRAVTSPLDKIACLMGGKTQGDG